MTNPESMAGAAFARRALPRSVAIALCILAATPPASAQVQFRNTTGSLFPAPNPAEWTNQITIGDIDGDGDLDIFFANGGNFSSAGPDLVQRVYVNDGAGVFTDESGTRLGFSGLCRGVELGDIDADGDLDAIFVQDFNRQPRLFQNDGNGFFTDITAANVPAMTMSSSRAQFGDIDNDGDLDAYITNGSTANRFGCGQYRVWVNDGTGVFTDETAARHPIANVCQNMDCIFGDLDNDFDLDVKTASTGTNNSRLYRNDGSGVFSLDTGVPSDTTCYSYDLGDIDGDGLLDMVGANGLSGSSSEILLLNDGVGGFSNASTQISPNPSIDDNDTKFLDFDNDGDLDLLVGSLGSGERLYENDGLGNFTQTSGVMQTIGDSTLDIAVADLNGDGRLDIVTAQGESGAFENLVYINNGPMDTRAPRIIATETRADTTDTVGPYVVRALILDDMSSDRNFFDTGIELGYTVNGGPAQVVPMRHSGGQVYRGVIPGTAGGLIEYTVQATDFAGNLGVGLPESFVVVIPADVTADGRVDVSDLLAVLGTWGPCVCPEDTNDDGEVNVTDLLAVLAAWTL